MDWTSERRWLTQQSLDSILRTHPPIHAPTHARMHIAHVNCDSDVTHCCCYVHCRIAEAEENPLDGQEIHRRSFAEGGECSVHKSLGEWDVFLD